MIYYGNPSSPAIRDKMTDGSLGCIDTPRQGKQIDFANWDVIADNGCFSNRWSFASWSRWVKSLPRSVRFVVCPDVVDLSGRETHEATLDRWRWFSPFIVDCGFVPAFVLQAGSSFESVPERVPLFVGGSTEWKLGPEARDIAERASSRGQWVHMGRVNSDKRLSYAASIGCSSADGTFLTFGPDANLPRLLRWKALDGKPHPRATIPSARSLR